MNLKIPHLLIIFFMLISSTYGQIPNKADSILNLINKENNDSIEIELYLELGNLYASTSFDTTINYYKTALDISTSNNDSIFELLSAKIYRSMAFQMKKEGQYDLSIQTYKKALAIYKKYGRFSEEAICYNYMGIIYDRVGNYPLALENYHKELGISEILQDTSNIASIYNNIGSVHFHLDDNEKAIEYYNYAIEVSKKQNNVLRTAAGLVNIGLIYCDNKEYDTALESYRAALKIYKTSGVEDNIASCYVNMGIAMRAQGDTKQALLYYKKALRYAEKLDNKYHLAILYGNIAYLNITIDQYNKAIENAIKSLKYAEEINSVEDSKYAYKYISEAYQKKGNFEKALKYYKQYHLLKDSIVNVNKNKVLAEMETRFQTAKKEQQILLQEAELKMNKEQIISEQAENKMREADANRKALERNYLFIGLVLMVLLVFVIFRNFKQKKKANSILVEQKTAILEKNEELNQQNEEIVAQRDEIEKQKIILQHKDERITDSIDYATRLQESILPEMKVLRKHFADHFVLFKPKDKVSGDFYWWAQVENHVVLTAADCTGHGVPGAFMSMLGVSFLRETVMKEYITHTGVILRKLRKEVVKALKQTGELGTHKDGMDMALISINLDTKMMQYSGANNPLYIITSRNIKGLSPIENLSGSKQELLYEIKPDKMPIAIYDKMDKFTTHEIQLAEGDQLYVFSDGFVDQFGGAKEKKYKSRPFKRLLVENAYQPMKNQKEILNTTFQNWKGKLEQIDDMVIVGIKI